MMFWETVKNWHGQTALSSWVPRGDKPVMVILLPFAREKDGAGRCIRKGDWGQCQDQNVFLGHLDLRGNRESQVVAKEEIHDSTPAPKK